MSTELMQAPTSGNKLSQWIARPEIHDQIIAAVGDVMDGEQFIAHAMVSFNRPEVKNCTAQSKLAALYEMAAMGLLETCGQIRLIKYGEDIKAMPMWVGYKAVMERHPSIMEVTAEMVHVTDILKIENGVPSHSYDPFDEKRTFTGPKDIRGGYLRVIYADGRPPRYHYVPVAKIEKNRACAQTQKVWTAWYKEMAIKTIYRDAYARRVVPVDPLWNARMKTINQADDVILGNDPSCVAVEGTRTERLADKLTHKTPSPAQETDAEEPIDVQSEPEPEPAAPVEQEPSADADLFNEFFDLVNQAESKTDVQFLLKKYLTSFKTTEYQGRAQARAEMRIADIAGKRGTGSNKQKSILPNG